MCIWKTELKVNGSFRLFAAGNIYIVIYAAVQAKMVAQVIFLNSFTICSLCKRKFVVYPFVDKETNGSNDLQLD
jgi:hypothetical protein